MILVQSQPFQASTYHQRVDAIQAASPLAKGLVVPVGVAIEDWRSGTTFGADAFLDTGADVSIISLRWVLEHAMAAPHAMVEVPPIDPDGRLAATVTIELGGCRLPMSAPGLRPYVGRQGLQPVIYPHADWSSLYAMPGYEDLLLGRDFLRAFGLLLCVDSSDDTVTVLYPVDEANEGVRRRVRAELRQPR